MVRANLTQAEVIDKVTDHSRRVLRGFENESVKGLAQSYRMAADQIEGRLAVVMKEFPGGKWNLQTMTTTGRDRRLFNEINQILGGLIDDTNGRIEIGALKQIDDAGNMTAYALDQASPPNILVKIPTISRINAQALLNQPYEGAMFSQRIGIITDQMAGDIRGQLMQSMINGESMAKAAIRVSNVIGTKNLTNPTNYLARAKVIARTEIMRAQNLGRAVTFEDNADLVEALVWVATGDGRLCPYCLRRDGLTREQITDASSAGDPWGNKAEPPLHPNCRCTFSPKMKTWKELGIDIEDTDRDDDNWRVIKDPETGQYNTVSVETFDKWKERRAADIKGETFLSSFT